MPPAGKTHAKAGRGTEALQITQTKAAAKAKGPPLRRPPRTQVVGPSLPPSAAPPPGGYRREAAAAVDPALYPPEDEAWMRLFPEEVHSPWKQHIQAHRPLFTVVPSC